MPAPQFILNYSGTKYNESKQLDVLNVDYSQYDTILEPFGGSFGFSRHLYYKLGHTHLQFKIYDSNEKLIDFYNHLKKLIIEDTHETFFEEYRREVKKLHEACPYKRDALNTKKLIQYMKTYEHNDVFIKWLFTHNHYSGKCSMYKNAAYKKNAGFTEIFKQCEFICVKCEDIPHEILYNEKTLIYLDPPYIVTDNSTYDTQFNLNDVFEIIEQLLTTANCILVHQYNFLLCRAFRDVDQHVYKKIYGSSKRVDHVVFYNGLAVSNE